MTVQERFWPKVNKNGPVSKHNPSLGKCWLWLAALRGREYGAFRIGGAADGRVATEIGQKLII